MTSKTVSEPLAFMLMFALGVLVGPSWGTIYVDDDAPNDPTPGDPVSSDPIENGSALHPFDSIQEAINSAGTFEEIVVADGTYAGIGNYNISFGGKAVFIHSANGPANCIIDAQGLGRVFSFTNENNLATLDGLTITGGLADSGGGISCNAGGNPTIKNCTVTGNTATDAGGGILVSSPGARVIGCTITGNSANRGGGVAVFDGRKNLEGCRITGNTAAIHGGGLFCGNGPPRVVYCTITNNQAPSGGGVACIGNMQAEFVSCAVQENTGTVQGGGFYVINADVNLSNCIVTGNSSSQKGGGVFVSQGDVEIRNSTISMNSASQGGGIYAGRSRSLTSCSILWGNSATDTGAQVALSGEGFGSAIYGVGTTNLEGGEPAVAVDSGAELFFFEGNIDADPMFASPLMNQFFLLPNSPCIDAGSNSAIAFDVADLDRDGDITEAVALDHQGAARRVDYAGISDTGFGSAPIVDMGAYEFVDCNMNGVFDAWDIESFASADCDLNQVPDECESDCNSNSVADACDISSGVSADCNRNGVPDECNISPDGADCNENGVNDDCDLGILINAASLVQSPFGFGYLGTFEFSNLPPAAGPVTLVLRMRGDTHGPTENAFVLINGSYVGTFFGASALCSVIQEASAILSAAQFNSIVSTGAAEIIVVASSTVGPFYCDTTFVSVELIYESSNSSDDTNENATPDECDGACCMTDSSCVIVSTAACLSLGGESDGVGTLCEGDADSDGVDGNCGDACPTDPNKVAPGQCGCGIPDTDTDGDGTANCNDLCPFDPLKIHPGLCGCGTPDSDTDHDGAPDCDIDQCPSDPNKILPGFCGCGVSDVDTDGDTVSDCNDVCPGDDDTIDIDIDGHPDCVGAPIPTTTTWGLVAMTLLLLCGAQVMTRSIRRPCD